MSSRARTVEVLGFGALLAAAIGLFFWRVSSQVAGLSSDQAESLVLARSLVNGLGLRLTEWSSASAGPANLVWLGVQALVLRLGASVEVWLPRVSSLLLVCALVAVALRGAWVWRRPVQLEDALPALGLSLVTATAEAAALGSGSTGWVLALAGVVLLMGRGLSTGKSSAPAIAIGALCLFRPSAIWLLLVTVPAWWVAARVEGRPGVREALRFLVTGLFVAALVFGFRFLVLGSLPIEGMLPSSEGSAGTLGFLTRQSRWFFAALAGALIAGVWRRFHLRGGGTVLAWVLMTLVLANWTDSARTLFLGCVPLLAMLVGDGLSAARMGFDDEEAPRRSLSGVAFVSLLLLLSLATMTSFSLGLMMRVAGAPPAKPEVTEELLLRGVRQPLIAWSDPLRPEKR